MNAFYHLLLNAYLFGGNKYGKQMCWHSTNQRRSKYLDTWIIAREVFPIGLLIEDPSLVFSHINLCIFCAILYFIL